MRQAYGSLAAGFIVVLLSLGGCAGTVNAPVEVRPGPAQNPAVPPGQSVSREPGEAPALPWPDAQSGSATVFPLESEPTRGAEAPVEAPPRPALAREKPPNRAVVALVNRANRDAADGRHATAAASLERAIKIEPGNAWLWHRLASTRFDQERPGQALSLATRSNSLAGADDELRARNWRLIARVHRMRGEEVAAQAAEDKANLLAAPRT